MRKESYSRMLGSVRFALCLALLGAAACAETRYSLRDHNRPVRFSTFTEEEGYRSVRRFEIKRTRWYILWGTIPVFSPNLEEILADETTSDQPIGNLRITERYGPGDGLIDAIVYGLIRPYSVILEGEVFEKIPDSKKTSPEEQKENSVKPGAGTARIQR